ncbi:hypothetical protein CLV98_12328 [Dyadobacter jejuensis]|uniref:Outer membrane efflux protein n=1 Tax=Dyadobacter jejuensis TaxID=1082580 RepID=A0A316A979_9BACT|nr:hypothetical protein [Dyadobacter jejuensis]PWJ53414.1 hypothetical protein CLV98_12328 [Dyadobacter jejuensis]
MKKIGLLFFLFVGLGSTNLNAQMVTNDPIHTAITTLIKMFQDPSFKSIVSNIEKLKKVTSAVRQFHRGTEIVSSISGITSKLTAYSTAIAKDGHIYPVEYKLMSQDIQMFTQEATKLVKDMKSATAATGGVLQMTDAERAKWIDETYLRVSSFESKITRYFENIQNVSIKRSASKADVTATANLYKVAISVPQGYFGTGVASLVDNRGYDLAYNDSLTIPLDYLYETQAYKDFQKKMRECEFRNQMFYKRQEYEANRLQTVALTKLTEQGYQMVAKNGFFQSQAKAQSQLNTYIAAVGDSTTYNSNANVSGTVDLENFFENEIMAIYDPSGKRITSEVFQMQVEFLAKELYIQYGIDQQLEEEYKIGECKELAQSFDAIMKAAEQEYLNNL